VAVAQGGRFDAKAFVRIPHDEIGVETGCDRAFPAGKSGQCRGALARKKSPFVSFIAGGQGE
jgi:hypothetical protein